MAERKKRPGGDADNAGRSRPRVRKRRPAGGGKGERRTPAMVERQARVFDLSVLEGMTVREIAAHLGIAKSTVTADMRAEERVRVAELTNRRESEVSRSIRHYEDVIRRARERGRKYQAIIDASQGQGLDEPEDMDRDPRDVARRKKLAERRAQAVKVVDETLAIEIQARQRIDKLLGLEAAVKVDPVVNRLVEALTGSFDP